MCKYCEDLKGWGTSGYREWTPNGGAKIIFDPEDVGFLLRVSDGFTYSIKFCPWCGRKLELPEEEPEFSAENEITRLEGRINHTNTMLYGLVDYLVLMLECPDRPDPDTKFKVLNALRGIRGKI